MAKEYTSNDPVCERNGQWFFSDECWANEYGPYFTEVECRQKLAEYCKVCLGR